MPNKRMIYQDMFEDDEVGALPVPVRLLWVGLISCMADDQGRLLDNASLIKSKVFAFDMEITNENVADWVNQLVKSRMLIRYRSGGKSLLQIRSWWEYQTPSWAQESKYDAPGGWVDRIKVHTVDNKVKSVNWEQQGGLPTPVPTPVPTDLPTPVPTGIADVKSDVKSDVNGESEQSRAGAAAISGKNPELYVAFEAIRPLDERTISAIDGAVNIYSAGWVRDAIVEATGKGKTFGYINAILERWKRDGRNGNGNKTKPTGSTIEDFRNLWDEEHRRKNE